jgi:hypothetical protein
MNLFKRAELLIGIHLWNVADLIVQTSNRIKKEKRLFNTPSE